ncbi:hypothetical protein PENTCL1PPCAC_17428 [Pristionchus entomophagus]|uniref:Glycosyltransferase family 92 protein n=1 Tax=Pristionchus entomophagus TaxID=358040 RepID=A0AAV5TM23_9BILA|nr:hypothetical protein PENTCL1PPCAC_17428 [Pristionchus entomophagus]
MKVRKVYLLCCLIGLLILYIQVWTFGFRVSKHYLMEQLSEESRTNFSSIFIYRAYYDDRAVKNTIRILAISKCLKKETKLRMKANGMITRLKFQPVEGGCPWAWAKKCEWNAYEFLSVKIFHVPDQIEIMMDGDRSVIIDVERRVEVGKGEIQVCVPPLYWYHDWSRLILFFELWRKHNVTFIMYANSISTSAARVIEYYNAQGLVQLVNWPMLPSSANGEDPNAGLYRLSHSLAHNDCALRMGAEYGVLLDVDEFIHISNNLSLLDYIQPCFDKESKLGSLMFKHFGLKMGHLNGSFDGIVNAEYFTNDRPTKTVFKPESVRFLSTHWVFVHEPPSMRKKKVSESDGRLLHYRMNFDDNEQKNTTRLRDIDLDDIQWRAREAARNIFGDEMPPTRSEASNIIEKCNSKWRSQGCKVPLLHCRKDLEDADDWVFLPPTDDSFYRLL